MLRIARANGLVNYPIPNAVGGNEEVQFSRVSAECPFVLAFRQRYTGATQTVRRRFVYASYRNNKFRG